MTRFNARYLETGPLPSVVSVMRDRNMTRPTWRLIHDDTSAAMEGVFLGYGSTGSSPMTFLDSDNAVLRTVTKLNLPQSPHDDAKLYADAVKRRTARVQELRQSPLAFHPVGLPPVSHNTTVVTWVAKEAPRAVRNWMAADMFAKLHSATGANPADLTGMLRELQDMDPSNIITMMERARRTGLYSRARQSVRLDERSRAFAQHAYAMGRADTLEAQDQLLRADNRNLPYGWEFLLCDGGIFEPVQLPNAHGTPLFRLTQPTLTMEHAEAYTQSLCLRAFEMEFASTLYTLAHGGTPPATSAATIELMAAVYPGTQRMTEVALCAVREAIRIEAERTKEQVAREREAQLRQDLTALAEVKERERLEAEARRQLSRRTKHRGAL